MKRLLTALALVLFACPAWADFSVVALPDTQNYSQDYPATYDAQTQWVVSNTTSRNIQFVSHLGDIVNEAATIYQWQNAYNSMLKLDNAGMPYGTAVGNHDIHYPGDYYDPNATNYLTYFNPSRYAGKSWFGGSSPSGLSNYEIIEVDGVKYLFLHLLVETPAAELAWAQTILNRNQDKPTWVSTHRYLYDWSVLGAGRYDDFTYTFEPLYRDDGVEANDFFHNFVAANRQIYLVYAGHCNGEYRQTSTNNFGLPVYEILADYQDGDKGGDGWMRINTLRPSQNRIDVESYSPTRNEYQTDDNSRFSLNVNFAAYTAGAPFLNFQQGVAGYSGTRDTWINQASAGSSYGSSATITVDNDVSNSAFSDKQGQGLVRFDDLFQDPVEEGDPAPTRIPRGARITSAKLLLTLKDDVDSPSCGGLKFSVYRMTRDWNESSTWNSLSGGLAPGSDMQSSALGTFAGDNDPDNDYGRSVDVTAAVQAWANGEANYGFGIVSGNVDWCDDGVDIYSSKDGTVSNRPMLSVTYTYDVANEPPVVTQGLRASSQTVGEGEEVDLTMAATDPNAKDPIIFRINGQDVGYATGSGSVRHAVLFESAGTYTFQGQVADDQTTVDAGSVTITVVNQKPVITSLTPSQTADVGRVVRFQVEASDTGGHKTLSAAWDLNGDGRFDDLNGFSGSTSFTTVGVHVVKVRVTDDAGASTDGQFTVTVADTTANGDFYGNGGGVDTVNHVFTDPDDQQALAFCKDGASGMPTPPAPYTAANCLSAFDANDDGHVNDVDERLILGFEPEPVQVPSLSLLGLGALATLLLALGARLQRRA